MDIAQNNSLNDSYTQPEEDGQKGTQSFALVLAVVVCVLFSVFFAASKFARQGQLQEIRLETRINPNDAPAASLVRLPGIGISRASAIVAYREDFIEQGRGKAAFQDCNDLQKVKGIGPKTAQNLCQWLKFE